MRARRNAEFGMRSAEFGIDRRTRIKSSMGAVRSTAAPEGAESPAVSYSALRIPNSAFHHTAPAPSSQPVGTCAGRNRALAVRKSLPVSPDGIAKCI